MCKAVGLKLEIWVQTLVTAILLLLGSNTTHDKNALNKKKTKHFQHIIFFNVQIFIKCAKNVHLQNLKNKGGCKTNFAYNFATESETCSHCQNEVMKPDRN